MIDSLPLKRRSQPEVRPGWRELESGPKSVADSWRPVARSHHEAYPDSRRLVLRSGVPCPQSAARDLRRSPRQKVTLESRLELGMAGVLAGCSSAGRDQVLQIEFVC